MGAMLIFLLTSLYPVHHRPYTSILIPYPELATPPCIMHSLFSKCFLFWTGKFKNLYGLKHKPCKKMREYSAASETHKPCWGLPTTLRTK